MTAESASSGAIAVAIAASHDSSPAATTAWISRSAPSQRLHLEVVPREQMFTARRKLEAFGCVFAPKPMLWMDRQRGADFVPSRAEV